MPKASKSKWLLFVDTNILLDFYRLGGDSAERQLSLLEKHKDSLITTDQVWMEFLSNRQTVIVKGLEEIGKPSNHTLPPIIRDTKHSKLLAKSAARVKKYHAEVHRSIEGILSNPSSKDMVFRALSKIFARESPLNLRRPSKQRYEIRRLARKRWVLGYPPRKKGDTMIGDAINWEWIVHCAKTQKRDVLVVSRDGDFGLRWKDSTFLNDWLVKEFRERTKRGRRVELTGKLTSALERLDEDITEEDIAEEKRVIQSGDIVGGLLPDENYSQRLLMLARNLTALSAGLEVNRDPGEFSQQMLQWAKQFAKKSSESDGK